MITAPPGIVALYKRTIQYRSGTGETGTVTAHDKKRVIAFNDDGEAMVVGASKLVHASSLDNFDGIEDEETVD